MNKNINPQVLKDHAKLLMLSFIVDDEGLPGYMYNLVFNFAGEVFGEPARRLMVQMIDATDGMYYVPSDNFQEYLNKVLELGGKDWGLGHGLVSEFLELAEAGAMTAQD